MTHALQYERLSIGIGCSPRADSEDVVRLVKASIDPIPSDTILATIDRRASIGEAVASVLGLRLVLFPSSVLTEVAGITTHSPLALATAKTANVAEASALASLGSAASLIVPQLKGRLCTCAVAALRMAVEPSAVRS
jgi:cobalamin biosynthesis protein CbiG